MAAPIFLAAKAAASAVAKKAAQRAAVQQAAKTAVKVAAARKGTRGGADSERNEKEGKRSVAMLFVGLLAVVVVIASSIVNGTVVGLASIVMPAGYTDVDACQIFPEYGGEEDPVDDEPDHDHDEDGGGAGNEDSGGDDPPESEEGVIFPLPMDGSWRLTSKYGPRNIGGGASRYHRGTDFGAPRGTPIFSPLDGIVVAKYTATGGEKARGKVIRIRHTFNGRTFETLSQHLDGWASGIRVGSKVKAGQVVAYVGNTGLSIGKNGGYHLHFELWTKPGKWDSTVDPMPWFKSNGAKGLGKPIVPDPGMEDVYGEEEWSDLAEVCELDPPDNGGGPLEDYGNGKIPEDMLASPEFDKKVLLDPKAAIALEKMNKAYKEQFGVDLRIVTSYRSLADQEACKEEKTGVPTLIGLCPAPGKDPFGMGRMIEVGGKAADKGSAEYAWLVENAPTYKWKQFSAVSYPRWWKYAG